MAIEATVYQRLDDRIASFESVVGELQPILSRVANVIKAAAMANDKQRNALISKEIEEINRQVSSAEITALNLNQFTQLEAEPVASTPPPVTLSELESTLLNSSALHERLRPNPELLGSYLLDWHGKWRPVTFDPRLFDEHPNTLTLLSYGSELLSQLLEIVQPPTASPPGGKLARCSDGGKHPAVGYYQLSSLNRLSSLTTMLNLLDQDVDIEVAADTREKIEGLFVESMRERNDRDAKSVVDRRNAHLSSLTEEIRQLLIEAAYVELALAATRDLFDEPLPLDFSEQAYERLKRHKVPFSGALKIAGVGLPKPRPDDSMYLRFRETKKDALHRRFDSIRAKLIDRLKDFVETRKAAEQPQHQVAGLQPVELRVLTCTKTS